MKNTVIPTVISIPNCDQTRKARVWFGTRGLAFHFRDFRSEPLQRDELEQAAAVVGLERLINKKSTTWRTLGAPEGLNAAQLLDLALEYPTLLKRPLVKTSGGWLCGVDESIWEQTFVLE